MSPLGLTPEEIAQLLLQQGVQPSQDMVSPAPNPLLMGLSRTADMYRGALNAPGQLPEGLPLLGGMGAGDFMFGQAPEALSDYSYGFGPFSHGSGLAFRTDPRVLDIATAPFVGGAVSKSVPKVAKKVADRGLARGARQLQGTPGGKISHLDEEIAHQAVEDATEVGYKSLLPADRPHVVRPKGARKKGLPPAEKPTMAPVEQMPQILDFLHKRGIPAVASKDKASITLHIKNPDTGFAGWQTIPRSWAAVSRLIRQRPTPSRRVGEKATPEQLRRIQEAFEKDRNK